MKGFVLILNVCKPEFVLASYTEPRNKENLELKVATLSKHTLCTDKTYPHLCPMRSQNKARTNSVDFCLCKLHLSRGLTIFTKV